MSDPYVWLWLVLALVGLVGSALCSGLEVGFYSVSRVLVRVRASEHAHARMLHKQIDRPVPVLTTLLAWNNVFNYVATLAITALLTRTGLGDAALIVLQAFVLTPVILIFAESLPKELFRSRANAVMERFSPALRVMRLAMTIVPVVPMITLVTDAISAVLGGDLSGEVRSAREGMGELLKHGDETISASQTELIDRALRLDQSSVRDVMVPVARAVRFSESAGVGEVLRAVARSAHSRYPIHDARGEIVGCVRTVDLHAMERGRVGDAKRPVASLDEGVSVRDALVLLRAEEAAMGVVTRKGRAVGIVTRKDLLGPLLGAEVEDW